MAKKADTKTAPEVKETTEAKVVEETTQADTTADTKTAPETAKKSGGKIKIKLKCDVLTNDGKLKEGETLEVTQEQLDTFAKSFYERA